MSFCIKCSLICLGIATFYILPNTQSYQNDRFYLHSIKTLCLRVYCFQLHYYLRLSDPL
jgi:hypothetical protein